MKYLLLISVLPSIILLLFIYTNDKIEKESKRLILKLFLFGLIIAPIIGEFENFFGKFLFPFKNETIRNFVDTFFIIAFLEEGGKFWIIKEDTWKNKKFNYTFDGLVYAVSASLGFATIENIFYVFSSFLVEETTAFDSYYIAAFTGILRMIFSIPLHFSCAVLMGFFYGKAKLFHEYNIFQKSKFYNFLAVFLPVIGHGLYDFGLFSAKYSYLSVLTAIILDLLAVFLIIYSKKKNYPIPNSGI